MHKKTFPNQLPLLQFSNLSQFSQITHFMSTREGGFSQAPFDSLNLGTNVNDDLKTVEKNRQTVADAIKAPVLLFPQQTHSSNVKIIDSHQIPDLSDTDAIITNQKNIGIAVLSADCVPILLYDKQNQVIGAVHSGWRGSVKQIVSKTLQAMKKHFGSQAQHIIVGIGACISKEVYEIGSEVIKEVVGAYKTKKEFIYNETPDGKGFLDLKAMIMAQLHAEKVPTENIEVSNYCTYSQNDVFFSARKGHTGRFGAGIMLK